MDLLTDLGLTRSIHFKHPWIIILNLLLSSMINYSILFIFMMLLVRRLIGRFLYLTVTKPDIAFSVQYLSKFLQAPKRSHWIATLWVIKYITNQVTLVLFFSRCNYLHLSAFAIRTRQGVWSTMISNMLMREIRKFSNFMESKKNRKLILNGSRVWIYLLV